jgi:hypothetical protein
MTSRAWENICSAPLVGREEPATLMLMPEMMIGRIAIHTLSSMLGRIRSALSMMVSAVYFASSKAERENSSFLILRANSQSFSAVELEMTSAHPAANRR